MTEFKRNRYNPNELLKKFSSAEIKDHGENCYIRLELESAELEIYFPVNAKVLSRTMVEKAKSVLANIRSMDNLVQESCIALKITCYKLS